MKSLYQELRSYADRDLYPAHMPGHKRNAYGEMSADFAAIDVTEVEGTDNLHEAIGILRDAQEYAAGLCHAEETHFLVGGSTAGILAAISAAVPRGGTILMTRAAHRSAYHALYLRDLIPAYLFGSILEPFDLCEAITPQEVLRGLAAHPEAKAVFIVSPTYEGRLADVRSIAGIAHAHGIPLIVDEAHGAHLGLSGEFAPSASESGADLVIQSTHKTLPAPTQTGLLHVNGQLVDRPLLHRFLQIYQTSSPSYPLMAGIDNALRIMEQDGARLLSNLKAKYAIMMTELSECRNLQFLPMDKDHQDIGKMVISADGRMSGMQIADYLRSHGIETEMSSADYVLAMFTVGDTPEGYRRMTETLKALDAELSGRVQREIPQNRLQRTKILAKLYTEENAPCQMFRLTDAWDAPREYLPLPEAAGRIAGDFLYLYPPGTPILTPGEEIGEECIKAMESCLELDLSVRGLDEEGRIPVLCRSGAWTH